MRYTNIKHFTFGEPLGSNIDYILPCVASGKGVLYNVCECRPSGGGARAMAPKNQKVRFGSSMLLCFPLSKRILFTEMLALLKLKLRPKSLNLKSA